MSRLGTAQWIEFAASVAEAAREYTSSALGVTEKPRVGYRIIFCKVLPNWENGLQIWVEMELFSVKRRIPAGIG